MKKYLLIATLFASQQLQAQTTIHKLIDSVGSDWSRLTGFDDKLYIATTYIGGTQYEVDLTTYAKTPVAEFPVSNGQFTYQTAVCRDFVVLNNKVSKVLTPASTNDKYLVVADNSSYDTLIKSSGGIYDIKKVGNVVFVATPTNLYYTDFTPAGTVLLDTFAGGPGQYLAGSNYYYYVRRDPNNASIRDIIRTNGTTSTTLETVNSNNYYIDFIGEQGGDFYYSVTLNAVSPVIEIKKSTTAVPTALVNSFSINAMPSYVFTNSSVTAAGLGKLFMMIKSNTAPYTVNLYAYDIAGGTLTQCTDAVTSNVTFSSGLNKAAFSGNAFYFYTTGFYRNLWKSDGTMAGTTLYADTVDIRFFDPESNNSGLSDNGIFCDEYPVAGINTEAATPGDFEYHYGTSAGFNKFDLNTSAGSYPKDFVKINNVLYFLATESTTQFGKQSLYKVTGCGLPTAISSTNKATYELSVFPNPNKGIFTIQGSAIDGNTETTLYTVQGQKVSMSITTSSQSITVHTQNLPLGVYLLEVKGNGWAKYEKISVQ